MTARGTIAIAGLACVVAIAIGADLFPHGPTRVRTDAGVEVLRPPSARHWLGTDDRGRDVAARLAHGARTSLIVACGATLLAIALGAAAGATAAARRGAVDSLVVGSCDLLGALPSIVIVIVAQGLVGRASIASLIVLIAIPRAADVARIVRAEVKRALAMPFVEAARAVGATRLRLVARHALPHVLPQLAVAAAITFSSAVLSELALTFLGFGTPPPTASWGELLRQAQQNRLVWWLAVPAGGAVAFVALCANALADELSARAARRAPSLTRSERA